MPLHPLARDVVYEIVPLLPPEKVSDWFVKFFEDLKELDAISRRTKRRKDAQDLIDSLDLPMAVGDVRLWKLSVGAMEWLEGYPQRWWGLQSAKPDFRMVEMATLYAMAHRLKEDFANLVSENEARETISKWARGTRQAEDVLILSASYLLPQNDPIARLIMGTEKDSESNEPFGIETIAQKVSSLSGVSISSCIWEMSADNFWGLYCDWIDAEEDELNASLQAQKKAKHVETWVVKQKIALIQCRRRLLQGTKEWLQSLSDGASEKDNK